MGLLKFVSTQHGRDARVTIMATTVEKTLLPASGHAGSAFSVSSLLPPMIIVVVALAIHLITPLVGSYAERILIDMAIAMIAAISLNIVNGFTGQFSIGHAAFMALGGYMAAWISYYSALAIWKTTDVAAPSWIALLHAQSPASFGNSHRRRKSEAFVFWASICAPAP